MPTSETTTVDSYNLLQRDISALHDTLEGKQSFLKIKMKEAFQDLQKIDLPTKSQEEWKYSPIPKTWPRLEMNTQSRPQLLDAPLRKLEELGGDHLVWINGVFAPELSSIGENHSGISLSPCHESIKLESKELTHEWDTKDFFDTLNMAALQNTTILRLKGTGENNIVIFTHIITDEAQGKLISPRVIITCEKMSEISLYENVIYQGLSEGETWVNSVTEIQIEEGAKLNHILEERLNNNSVFFSTLKASVKSRASFIPTTILSGAKFSKAKLLVDLLGEEANVDASGLNLTKGDQHSEFHLSLKHKAPHTSGRQLFKSILSDKSHCAFTGNIEITKDSQKVSSSQLHQTLLLSPFAKVDTRPQLEVLADDVKCTHGASIGQIDESQRFYLISRGLAPDKVNEMLCEGFALDVLEQVQSKPIRTFLAKNLKQTLTKELRQ